MGSVEIEAVKIVEHGFGKEILEKIKSFWDGSRVTMEVGRLYGLYLAI